MKRSKSLGQRADKAEYVCPSARDCTSWTFTPRSSASWMRPMAVSWESWFRLYLTLPAISVRG